MNNIVNGIDVTNLENFAREVAADDTKAEVRFNVQTKWMGQTKSVTNVTQCRLAGRQIARDFQIVSDEPVELLGENTAPANGAAACRPECLYVGGLRNRRCGEGHQNQES